MSWSGEAGASAVTAESAGTNSFIVESASAFGALVLQLLQQLAKVIAATAIAMINTFFIIFFSLSELIF